MTRIIGGKYRGRKIQAPRHLPIRPTTDRAKEALFNILNNHLYFAETEALDLFSGTGNLTFEMISRGCPAVTAIDQNLDCIRFIKKTCDSMEISQVQIIHSEVMRYLKSSHGSFDLILADPPYDYTEYPLLIQQIFLRALLKDDGLLVVEHNSRLDLSELEQFREMRKYGQVAFSFFSWTEASF